MGRCYCVPRGGVGLSNRRPPKVRRFRVPTLSIFFLAAPLYKLRRGKADGSRAPFWDCAFNFASALRGLDEVATSLSVHIIRTRKHLFFGDRDRSIAFLLFQVKNDCHPRLAVTQ